MKLEITKIGDFAGVVFPQELLTRLGLTEGDVLYLTELPERAVKLSVLNPHFDNVMEIGRGLFDEYRETFRALAK